MLLLRYFKFGVVVQDLKFGFCILPKALISSELQVLRLICPFLLQFGIATNCGLV